MSSQLDEGQAATPAVPQGTEPGTQVPAQHQETSISKVDGNELNASSPEDTRKANDIETARWMKRVERQMRSMQQALEKSQQSQSPQGSPTSAKTQAQVTHEELLKNPIEAIQRLIDAKVGEIPQHLQQMTQEQSYERSRQDALRMIRTNSSVKADPEGQERISDILNEEDEDGNSLEKYAQSNPKHAAQLALKEYQSRYGNGARKAQGAPSKAQMQTMATAVTVGAPKGDSNQEAALLYKQILDNPKLMTDPEFRAKLKAFEKKTEMETLTQH